MHLNRHIREPLARGILSPIVIVAWVWMGMQVLLLLYFRTVLLNLGDAPNPLRELLVEILQGAPGIRPTFSTALLVVNLLFVGLLWSKFRSLRRRPRSTRLVAALTYVGATLMLGLLQWAWFVLLSSVSGQL